MEEMKRALSKFQSKGHFVWRETSISKKESFQSFYVTSWFNVEVSFFCSSVSIWQIMVDTSTEGLQLVVRKEELEQSTGEHLSWCISTGKQGFALHISGHPLLLSLELLFGWVGKMVWKLPKMTVLHCEFCICVATGTKIQTTSLLLSTCLRTEHVAFREPQLGTSFKVLFNILKNITNSGVWSALFCVFLFEGNYIISKSNLLRCPVHVSSMNWFRVFIGPGVLIARRLRGTKGRSGNIVPWLVMRLDGWVSRVQWQRLQYHGEDTGYPVSIMESWPLPVTTMTIFEVVGCFKLFNGRCFGVLNILGSFWRKRQTTKSVSSRMCSRVQPKAFVGFKESVSSHPTCHGKIVSRTTWLWDEKTCSL